MTRGNQLKHHRANDYIRLSLEEVRDHLYVSETTIAMKQHIHRAYRTNPMTIIDHMLTVLALTGDESVLDLGCGNGFFLKEVAARTTRRGRVVGVDVAPGILGDARRHLAANNLTAELCEGDASNLRQFEDQSFDLVMINYAIHHFPDIGACLAEVRRVLRPGGRLIVSTDSEESMAEMYSLHFDALECLGWPADLMRATQKTRFSLESGGPQLADHRFGCEVIPYVDTLTFSTAEPFIDFYVTGTSCCGALVTPDPRISNQMIDELREFITVRVNEEISSGGAFRLSKRSGSFICRPELL